MRLYGISFYCHACGKPIEKRLVVTHRLTIEKGEDFDGVCLDCDRGDDVFRVHQIEKRKVISGDQLITLIKQMEKESSEALQMIENYVRYNKKRKKTLKDGIEIEIIDFSITPYPRANETTYDEWLTMMDIAERYDIPKETVKTHKKRKKFQEAEQNGLTRMDGNVFEIHISEVINLYEKKLGMNPKTNP